MFFVCSEDGKILTVDTPMLAAPVQFLEMAFSGRHPVQNPSSTEIGEIWSSAVNLEGFAFGYVFAAETKLAGKSLSSASLGLKLNDGMRYLRSSLNSEEMEVLDPGFGTTLPILAENEFDLIYFTPVMPVPGKPGYGLALLGDLRKFVPVTRDRFASFGLNSDLFTLRSFGSVPVDVAVVVNGQISRVVTMECPGSDSLETNFNLDVNSFEFFCTYA